MGRLWVNAAVRVDVRHQKRRNRRVDSVCRHHFRVCRLQRALPRFIQAAPGRDLGRPGHQRIHVGIPEVRPHRRRIGQSEIPNRQFDRDCVRLDALCRNRDRAPVFTGRGIRRRQHVYPQRLVRVSRNIERRRREARAHRRLTRARVQERDQGVGIPAWRSLGFRAQFPDFDGMLAVEGDLGGRYGFAPFRHQRAGRSVHPLQSSGPRANHNLKRGILIARGAQDRRMPGTGAIVRPHPRKLVHYVDRHRRLSRKTSAGARKQDARRKQDHTVP